MVLRSLTWCQIYPACLASMPSRGSVGSMADNYFFGCQVNTPSLTLDPRTYRIIMTQIVYAPHLHNFKKKAVASQEIFAKIRRNLGLARLRRIVPCFHTRCCFMAVSLPRVVASRSMSLRRRITSRVEMYCLT